MGSLKRSSSSSLPIELVEEIFYKTPVASLVRFKPLCKQCVCRDTDNYKILRFDKGDKYVEIYEFKSKLWRSVEYASLDCCGVKLGRGRCHVNGNMYWIAYRKGDNSHIEFAIQSFDFSTEKFKHMCCIPFGRYNWLGLKYVPAVDLSGFGGDRLSLSHRRKDDVKMFDVWVTNRVTDRIVLLSKYINVNCPYLPILRSSHNHRFFTYFIHKTNNIMVWSELDFEKKSVYPNVYEMGEGKIKKQVETGPSKRSGSLLHYVMNYVPSLVPVPE
ncbi:unnamed protein product [Arabis nemorensis]|uniref:F-box associated beta-propeller type 1 domain-containing protein n=1 Tax=Arabis nemorensis TaxID=586526 RepID=A0A565CI23_9BRAS|nr:unnamed protein product [Arabis nemorensis]